MLQKKSVKKNVKIVINVKKMLLQFAKNVI